MCTHCRAQWSAELGALVEWEVLLQEGEGKKNPSVIDICFKCSSISVVLGPFSCHFYWELSKNTPSCQYWFLDLVPFSSLWLLIKKGSTSSTYTQATCSSSLASLGYLRTTPLRTFIKMEYFSFLPCNFLLNFSSFLLFCVRDAALGLPWSMAVKDS